MSFFKTSIRKSGVGTLLFCLLVGVIFTGVGLFMLKDSQIDPSWTRVAGTIIDASSNIDDGDTLYTPVVEYTVNDQSYKFTSSISTSSYPIIGGAQEVAYNPGQPQQAKLVLSTGSMAFIWIFPVIGVVVMIAAIIAFIRSVVRSQKIKNLQQSGQKLQGILVDIQTTGSDENAAYQVIVSAADTSGTVQNYLSDPLNGVAGLAMADFEKNPIPMDVYVNPANPKEYYVDIDDIPSLTPAKISELIQAAVKTSKPQ